MNFKAIFLVLVKSFGFQGDSQRRSHACRPVAEVALKSLSHTLNVMTGRGLPFFVVPQAERLSVGQSVDGVALKPFEERPMLVTVTRLIPPNSINLTSDNFCHCRMAMCI